jgi:hypothetical protein
MLGISAMESYACCSPSKLHLWVSLLEPTVLGPGGIAFHALGLARKVSLATLLSTKRVLAEAVLILHISLSLLALHTYNH